MKKLLRFLAATVLTLGLVFSNATTLHSSDTDVVMDYTVIKEFIADEDRRSEFLYGNRYNPNNGLTTTSLVSHENRTAHEHFEWVWTDHYMHWQYVAPDIGSAFVTFATKEYQTFVSPDSRGFTVTKVVDFDRDGKVDYSERKFVLVMQDNVVMMPDYPKGFRNLDWLTISQEEADQILQKEMRYWVKMAGKEA